MVFHTGHWTTKSDVFCKYNIYKFEPGKEIIMANKTSLALKFKPAKLELLTYLKYTGKSQKIFIT